MYIEIERLAASSSVFLDFRTARPLRERFSNRPTNEPETTTMLLLAARYTFSAVRYTVRALLCVAFGVCSMLRGALRLVVGV